MLTRVLRRRWVSRPAATMAGPATLTGTTGPPFDLRGVNGVVSTAAVIAPCWTGPPETIVPAHLAGHTDEATMRTCPISPPSPPVPWWW
jgi:hypothetical protein